MFSSQKLQSHPVIVAAFTLLPRQKPLALPWQPGSTSFQLSPEFPITTAEPLKTCLASESHEQKITPGNCGGLNRRGARASSPWG